MEGAVLKTDVVGGCGADNRRQLENLKRSRPDGKQVKSILTGGPRGYVETVGHG